MNLEIANFEFAKTFQENCQINSSQLLTNKNNQNKNKNHLIP